MRILFIEDDEDFALSVKLGLDSEGFIVRWITDGEEGLKEGLTSSYDLMILDLSIPNMSGEEICKAIRKNNRTFPIIILTGHQEVASKVNLLNSGADDYMTKPFSFAELIARINAISRRGENIKEDILSFHGFHFDRVRGYLLKDKARIHLRPKELAILRCLLDNRGIILSPTKIIEACWDHEDDLFSNALESHIRKIRIALEDKDHTIIKTINSRGYVIE